MVQFFLHGQGLVYSIHPLNQLFAGTRILVFHLSVTVAHQRQEPRSHLNVKSNTEIEIEMLHSPPTQQTCSGSYHSSSFSNNYIIIDYNTDYVGQVFVSSMSTCT
jgi:hypothetical protein